MLQSSCTLGWYPMASMHSYIGVGTRQGIRSWSWPVSMVTPLQSTSLFRWVQIASGFLFWIFLVLLLLCTVLLNTPRVQVKTKFILSVSIFNVQLLWAINYDWLRWVLVGLALALSSTVLLVSLWPSLRGEDMKTSIPVMFVLFLLHAGLAVGFKVNQFKKKL